MTPTHKRMMRILLDGEMHTKREMVDCLWDEASNPNTIHYHITTLRKALRDKKSGMQVVCISLGRSVRYQLVRLLRADQKITLPGNPNGRPKRAAAAAK